MTDVHPITRQRWRGCGPSCAALLDLQPDGLIITGDHSTPSALKNHSWHPVPVLLHNHTCRPDQMDVPVAMETPSTDSQFPWQQGVYTRFMTFYCRRRQRPL